MNEWEKNMSESDYVRLVLELWEEIQEGDQEVLDALELEKYESYVPTWVMNSKSR